MFRKKPTSIKKDIFKSAMILSLIMLIFFGIFFSVALYNSEKVRAYSTIKDNNKSANYFIDVYVHNIKNIVDFLAKNQIVQQAYQNNTKVRKEVLQLYKSIMKINKRISYIYSGYSNGYLLINNYTPPKGFLPSERPWYIAAMKTKPKTYVGEPYQEIKDKEWLISVNKALLDDRGRYVGVVAIDTSINFITKLLNEHSGGYKTSYSFVVNNDGEVIVHHKSAYLKKKMSEIIDRNVVFDKEKGEFNYKLGNISKIAYYSKIRGTSWVVITVVETGEIIQPIIKKVVFITLIVGLFAIVIALVLSIKYGKRFSLPLIQLQKKVQAIVSGESYLTNYSYPNNEIGAIAHQVGTLTEKELYNRTIALEETHRTIERLYDDIKKDISLAKQIQENILPEKFLNVQGNIMNIEYIPMSDIGGDLYDVVLLPSGIIRIFLADATGHGIQASLITMLIKSEYERIKYSSINTAELTKLLNNEFVEKYYKLCVFFTCIVVDIDITKKTLRYCSGGHPNQYLFSNDKSTSLTSCGKLVGAYENCKYLEKTLTWEDGDRLFLFTDGLYEEFNENQDELGVSELYNFLITNNNLPLSELVKKSVQLVQNHVGDGEINDDITVIGVNLLSSK